MATKPKKLTTVPAAEACSSPSEDKKGKKEVGATRAGKDVRLTAPHRKKLAHGNIKGKEELPPIEYYVYVPEEDIWIRRGSVKMAAKVANGFVEMNGMSILIRKNIYMPPENVVITPIPIEARPMAGHFFSIFDVVGIIAKILTFANPTMWARLRTVCKKFRNAVDEYATGPDLFHIDLFEKYAKKPWKMRIKAAPEKVQKLYVKTLGAGLMLRGHKGSWAVCNMWMTNKDVKPELRIKVLRLLTDREQCNLYQAQAPKRIDEGDLLNFLTAFAPFTEEEFALPVWHRYVPCYTPTRTLLGFIQHLESTQRGLRDTLIPERLRPHLVPPTLPPAVPLPALLFPAHKPAAPPAPQPPKVAPAKKAAAVRAPMMK